MRLHKTPRDYLFPWYRATKTHNRDILYAIREPFLGTLWRIIL
jgi:hypothetical protein